MIKFMGELTTGGNLYGFGLTEVNLNRLEFNAEPLLFDFGFAGHPELFCLIIYVGDRFNTPEDAAANINVVKEYCLPYLNESQGITPESLRMFPITRTVMEKFRSTPFWGFDCHIQITHPNDMQLIFAGPDERSIGKYLRKSGLFVDTDIPPQGFGKK